MSTYDTVLAGLGGQGILLASKVLMEQALQAGAETHGMAQRGGSVLAHVRVGPCESPEVMPGRAHLVLALEAGEGMRSLAFLAPGGTLIANAPGPEAFDPRVLDYIHRIGATLRLLPATDLAQQAGSVRSLNMVLVGAACGLEGSPFGLDAARQAVRTLVKPRFHASSLGALERGAAHR